MSSKFIGEPSKNSIKRSWQKVKIKGAVISEDGGGLEGLIGLEVMEKYNKNLVQRQKKVRRNVQKERKERQQNVKKRKTSESDSEINSEGECDVGQTNKPKKKKQKLHKKSKAGNVNTPGQFVLLKKSQESESEESEANECESDEAPELIPIDVQTAEDTDDLVGWNGLGVPETILKAIAGNGFKSPTQIQTLTLPAAIMGKKDILGAAETGSGKTLAFGIPILAGIMELKRRDVSSGIRKKPKVKEQKRSHDDRDNLTPPPEDLEYYPDMNGAINDGDDDNDADSVSKPLYALILTPTRELAVQVKDHIASVARYTGIKVAAIFGGMALVKQERVLKQCPEIVVATPGRFWELLELGNSHLNKMDNISFLVIDETDRMIEKGHFDELRLILKRLNMDESKKEMRQNFIFSATLSLVHDLPDHMQRKNIGRKNKIVKITPGMKIHSIIESLGISQPKIVDITSSQQTAQTLTESRLICPIDHKDYYLYYFLQKHPGRTIVFCNSIDCVKRLAQLFGLLGCQPLPLHANMIQKQRLKNLERFTENINGLLIATDVAARGLDIPDVQHVIHYQVPRTSENYVHRSGRTARANKDGITVIIMEPGEAKSYLKLCKTLDRSEDLPLFPVSERQLMAVKERVNLARDVDKLELRLKRTLSEEGWLKKNAEEMEIVINSDVDSENGDVSDDDVRNMEKSKDKRILATKRQQLSLLLTKPLFPKGFSYKYPTSSGKLQMPFMEPEPSTNNTAVKAMKEAIQDYKEAKKLRNKKKHRQNSV